MLKFLKSQIFKPSVRELAEREKAEAERSLLEAQTQFDLAYSAINFHENRIDRLTRFLLTGKIIEQDEKPEFNVH